MKTKLDPPDGYGTWLDYAIATMDTRTHYIENVFNGIEIDREQMRDAAKDELAAKDARIKELEAIAHNLRGMAETYCEHHCLIPYDVCDDCVLSKLNEAEGSEG